MYWHTDYSLRICLQHRLKNWLAIQENIIIKLKIQKMSRAYTYMFYAMYVFRCDKLFLISIAQEVYSFIDIGRITNPSIWLNFISISLFQIVARKIQAPTYVQCHCCISMTIIVFQTVQRQQLLVTIWDSIRCLQDGYPEYWHPNKSEESQPSDAILKCDSFVTVDETWVHHFDPESKVQSNDWWHPGSPPLSRFMAQPSVIKIMTTIFWDVKEIPIINKVPKTRIFNYGGVLL